MKNFTTHALTTTALVAAALLAPRFAAAHGDEVHETAIGQPGDAKKVTRTINVTMRDTMRFEPASVQAKRGETLRFVLKNEGQLKHEMVLGSIEELNKHAALMLKFPEMEHAEPNQASVAPGKTGELIWRFTKTGRIDFACLQAGHYEAGMKGQVIVAQADTSDMTDGEVRKVDKETKKITLKHGDIKNLDMPGMTMLFQVKDASMLDRVKAGDKVKFRAERQGGAIVLTEIETTK